MAHNLIIRGFDDKIHTQLGEMANQRGVSINSIVKDAVDKSMDRLAKEGDLFRCFCGPPYSLLSELLSKLKWYDATIEPYYYTTTNTIAAESINYQDNCYSNKNSIKLNCKVIKGKKIS